MISKPHTAETSSSDPRVRAGLRAEKQMAFYLHRAFCDDPLVHVLNDLRLVDPRQADQIGDPGICQIDHLVLHPLGAFIIESKSVVEEVSVRDDGSGGDEWTRRFKGLDQGMASPIQQARRQADFLRRFLQHDHNKLLGRVQVGFRTITKLLVGTDQRSFRNMPIQIIVAISDRGTIRRVNDWTEPCEPFQVFVSKADLVVDKIRGELQRHQSFRRSLINTKSHYGIWAMDDYEVPLVAGFLSECHMPPSSPGSQADESQNLVQPQSDPSRQTQDRGNSSGNASGNQGPECKHCGGRELSARWGKFGYYWKCAGCQCNTGMPTTCSVCGSVGVKGTLVRIRKSGTRYFRHCDQCGIEENIWNE